MAESVRILKDSEIQSLIDDVKPIPSSAVKKIKPMPLDNRRHMGHEHEVLSKSGKKYSIYVRLNSINAHEFSIILKYYEASSKSWYVLRRYNGSSHRHTNIIEASGSLLEYMKRIAVC